VSERTSPIPTNPTPIEQIPFDRHPASRIRRNAIRSLVFYSLDMLAAIAGWTWGFGLTVQNWPALIAILLVARWMFHTLLWAHYLQDAKEIAEAKFARDGQVKS
jgi:hypothetical protein